MVMNTVGQVAGRKTFPYELIVVGGKSPYGLALRVLYVGQLRGGVNQLLLCLNNYAYFKFITELSMKITIMQGGKQ
jgi:hypothetical protein